MKEFLFVTIVVGGTTIIENTEMLHAHEAFLVAGMVGIFVLLLVEPSRKQRYIKGLTLFPVFISTYGLLLKLPMLLMSRLNYYVAYILAIALLGIACVVILLFVRKFVPVVSKD